MAIIISAKTFKINKPQKDYVTKLLKKAATFSPIPVKEMKVELDHDHNQRTGKVFRVEMSVKISRTRIMAGQKAEHLREAIDLCYAKLVRQIKKYKTKKLRSKQPGRPSVRNT